LLNLTGNQESFSKQLPKNLISNFIYFLMNVAVGIFLVPYFIDNLGVAAYGIIPLATSMTGYVNLVMQSLNTSVSRYLTIDLQKQDFQKANKTFNTALFGILGIILLTIPLILLLSYYSPIFFDIPENQKKEASLLFLGVFGAFLIRAWGSSFGVSLFAYNRLDIQNAVNGLNLIVQTLLIILFFILFSPKLSYIGLAYFLGASIAFILTVFVSKKINPNLKVNINDFNRSQLKNLMGTGSWIIINQIGALLFTQIDLIVVNKLFGIAAGGEYSIVLVWSTVLRSIAGMLAGVLTPIILTYYAKQKFDDITTISQRAVKFMGLAMALPIGCICGFAPQILSLWVGSEFIKLAPLMWLLLMHLVINLSVLSLFSINVSYDKVRIPGLVTLMTGLGNLLLAIIIPSITGLGYYGVGVAGAIMLTAKNSVFTPWYAARVLGIPKKTFVVSMVPGTIAALMVAGIASLVNYYMNTSTLISLAIYCSLISLIYLYSIWMIGLDEFEKKFIKLQIPNNLISKLKHKTDLQGLQDE
jgi:O-antigen/teichoic acid export membrane protein